MQNDFQFDQEETGIDRWMRVNERKRVETRANERRRMEMSGDAWTRGNGRIHVLVIFYNELNLTLVDKWIVFEDATYSQLNLKEYYDIYS